MLQRRYSKTMVRLSFAWLEMKRSRRNFQVCFTGRLEKEARVRGRVSRSTRPGQLFLSCFPDRKDLISTFVPAGPGPKKVHELPSKKNDLKSSINGFMETRVSDFTTLKTVFVQDMKFMDLFGQPGPGPAGTSWTCRSWTCRKS